MKDLKNWWYYYKWYVICGLIIICIIVRIIGGKLGLWEKQPDCQIAYVGIHNLTDSEQASIISLFSAVCEDLNDDGEVIIKINQYASHADAPDGDTDYYTYAAEVSLIGDISDCDSYFFLTDDPETLQRSFHILANPDGSCPDDNDYTIDGKVFPLSLTNKSTMPAFYLGRRCFYTDAHPAYIEQLNLIWDNLLSRQEES